MNNFYKRMTMIQNHPRVKIEDHAKFCEVIRHELKDIRQRAEDRNLMNIIVLRSDIRTIKEHFPEIMTALRSQIWADKEITRILCEE